MSRECASLDRLSVASGNAFRGCVHPNPYNSTTSEVEPSLFRIFHGADACGWHTQQHGHAFLPSETLILLANRSEL
jgi:hypothetical protein